MSEMFVMRRANGDLFTEEINGKLGIPVWSNEESPARYKERNPELMTFLAARLTPSLINKIGNGLGTEGTTEFFLLAEDDTDADLEDGRPISLEEILPGAGRTLQPARLQL
ncbi:MAG: hypothetical protein AABN33_15460 [Acidobacteriota bacterium]